MVDLPESSPREIRRPFTQQTLLERRANLKQLVGADDQSRIQFSDEFDGDGAALFNACAEKELEGIVSKHALAYRSGRSKTWLKTKCFTESTFVVVGTDRDRKTGALMALLAHSEGLKYAGTAFITLGGDERKEFLTEVERLTTSWATLKSSRVDVKWCQPRLVVRVKHLAELLARQAGDVAVDPDQRDLFADHLARGVPERVNLGLDRRDLVGRRDGLHLDQHRRGL